MIRFGCGVGGVGCKLQPADAYQCGSKDTVDWHLDSTHPRASRDTSAPCENACLFGEPTCAKRLGVRVRSTALNSASQHHTSPGLHQESMSKSGRPKTPRVMRSSHSSSKRCFTRSKSLRARWCGPRSGPAFTRLSSWWQCRFELGHQTASGSQQSVCKIEQNPD